MKHCVLTHVSVNIYFPRWDKDENETFVAILSVIRFCLMRVRPSNKETRIGRARNKAETVCRTFGLAVKSSRLNNVA